MKSLHRHHPGYQTITANSWWCDDCLRQCHAIPPLDRVLPGHWSDFFVWLSQLLVKGYAAAISAVFGLIMLLLDDRDWYEKYAVRDSGTLQTLKVQEQWLLVERHRLLLAIDRATSHRGYVAFQYGHDASDIEHEVIKDLQKRLDITLDKLCAVQKKLEWNKHLLLRTTADHFTISQEDQHGGH